MRRAAFVFLALCLAWLLLAAACEEHVPLAQVSDASTASDRGPLESRPPGIVPSERRANASSSPVVFDPSRGGAWTANGDVGSVSYVDVDARRVVREIAVGMDIRSVALSPDAAWIAAVDRNGSAVALIDAGTGEVRRTVPLGPHPRACVWDAANPRWLYVAVEDDGAVAVIDRVLGEVAATIDVGRLPAGLAVSATRRELYVTHRIDGRVTVVDLHDRAVAAEVTLADEPFSAIGTPSGKPFAFESLAITPDGTHAWVPHELLAPTHPFVFDQTLFPAISVVDIAARVEQATDPNSPVIAGRKNLFDAIALTDPDGQPAVVSQICAVALHPTGALAWGIACASEDLLTFGAVQGVATDLLRNPGGDRCHRPSGLTLDDTGERVFLLCDQSHTLVTLDTAGGSLVQHTRQFGDPIPLVAADPVDPELREGETLFFRANSAKGALATTGRNWMSCGGCHLDGFGSSNLRLFEALVAHDPATDAQIGHVGLVDGFSTAPIATPAASDAGAAGDASAPASFNPHDVLVALLDQGGLAPDRTGARRDGEIDPAAPTPDAARMAGLLARVIARDLPQGPTWLGSSGKPNLDWDGAFCGSCHPAEYAAWKKSVHAHAAEDPMVLFAVGVEQQHVGPQYARLCAGCHDPVSARVGDVSFAARRGVTCVGCHDVGHETRAGGNGDLRSAPHDWAADHKTWALASLDRLRQPEFCGGCHQQFVPGSGLLAIATLDEYHASPFSGGARCVDCHMHRDGRGVADHRFPGGNVYLGQKYGDDALVQAQRDNLSQAVSLQARRVAGGVLVTVTGRGAGHWFPTGVTDIREPWVELQATDATGTVTHIGGPAAANDALPAGAARLGIDIADPAGTLLVEHELNAATRVPFDLRVPAGEAAVLFVPVPSTLPAGTPLDAVLYYRNVRTAFFRAAAAASRGVGDPDGAAPTNEVARTRVDGP